MTSEPRMDKWEITKLVVPTVIAIAALVHSIYTSNKADDYIVERYRAEIVNKTAVLTLEAQVIFTEAKSKALLCIDSGKLDESRTEKFFQVIKQIDEFVDALSEKSTAMVEYSYKMYDTKGLNKAYRKSISTKAQAQMIAESVICI